MPTQKPPLSDEEKRRRARIRARKKRLRQRQQRRRIILFVLSFVIVLLLLLLAAGISSCFNKGNTRSDSSGTADGQSVSEASGDGVQSGNVADAGADISPTDTPAEPVSLTVSVVGDCTLGKDESFDYDTSLNAYYDVYGSSYFMQNVKSIFEADDLTIANMEGTLTESEDRQDRIYAFKAPASYAKILTDGAIEAVNTANNHAHDYGDQGYQDTIDALDAAGIVNVGYEKTAVVDVKGVKVGLVGIYVLIDFMGVEPLLKENIQKVKEEGAQLTIVIFHWGNELEQEPDEFQYKLGRIAIDEGADLVCGHHPHVIQGIESYKGRNIVYSLANFCFGGNAYPTDKDTFIYQQTFTVTGNDIAMDNDINIIPCSISSDPYFNDYCPTPASGDEAQRIMDKINERTSYLQTPEPQNITYTFRQ